MQPIHTLLEQMRRNFAGELHDNIGQRVTALLLAVECMRQKQENTPASATEWQAFCMQTSHALRNIQKEVRYVAHGLYLPVLQNGDISTALQHLCTEYAPTALRVHYFAADIPFVSMPVALAIYRIVQEALNNIACHAKATAAHVSLHIQDKKLCVMVEDDGQGFDPQCLAQGGDKHLGLRLMQERALLLQGAMHIESHQGQGTVIVVHIPMGDV